MSSEETLVVCELEVPGLYYIDTIDEDTADTIKELDKCKWLPLSNASNSRLVQHYGFKYNYATYQINEKCEPIPSFLDKYKELLYNICLQLKIIDSKYEFNQCIVNNYLKGQGISAHIDVKKYGGVIGCFTIGSGATMVFENANEKKEVYVKPNSLYIMSGDSRFIWKHSMTSRKFDIVDDIKNERGRRISITFRNVPN
jgi:alkylated DNA repair dioxygenase AlkB